MRRSTLPALLTVVLVAAGALIAWAATASFTPPPQPGTIFAVVNADRSPGALTTRLTVTWGSFRKTVIRGNPYGNCSGRLAGFVLMVRNGGAAPAPFTLTTTGAIARPPYQGLAPPEVGHACYKLEKMRVTR